MLLLKWQVGLGAVVVVVFRLKKYFFENYFFLIKNFFFNEIKKKWQKTLSMRIIKKT